MRRTAWSVMVSLVFASAASAQVPGWERFDTVAVQGIDLAYREVGAGEVLVLLHGFQQTGAFWQPYAEALAERFRLIVPDLRGHGRSGSSPEPFTHRQAARDILSLLDHLGVDRARAIGFSSGGMTLLHMATAEPSRLESMVLMGTTPYFPEEARQVHRRNGPDSTTTVELAALAAQHSRGETQAMELIRTFYGFKDSFDDMNFTPPLLGTIQARTLIVHGDRDAGFPIWIPVELYRSIPRSALWVLPNRGHQPIPNDELAREYFLNVILSWLTGS